MNRKSTLLLCWLLCLVGTLQAQRIYVKAGSSGNGTSWAQASGDLRAALQSATSGTEIWVAQGNYYPTTCTSCTSIDRNLYFELKDNIQLYGGFNGTETDLSQRDWIANPCVLSGDIDLDASQANNSYTIVYSRDVSATTVIDGFYIQQGNAEDLSVSFGAPGNSGGGWYNDGSQSGTVSNPMVRNCTFRWNTASGLGGGVYNDGCFGGEGNPTLINCVFEQNSSPQGGGGMYNNGSFSGICNPTYIDCKFISNTTISSGAGLFNNGQSGNSSPIINTTTFFDNRADFYGGGIYNLGKKGISSPKITNCLFNANRGNAAGGVYNLGAENGNSSPIITNTTFYGNVASVGACVYNQASDITGTCEGVITNCIFYGNDATSGFGYVFQNGYASPTISFSLVQVNNCTELNTGINSTVNCGSGMIYNQNPLFENPIGNNFKIASGSPVIDVGSNSAINAAGGTMDLDNKSRIVNGTVDFGAYEFQGGLYTPPTIIDQPEGQTVCEGTATQLTLSVIGTRPLAYQWQKNGTDVQGATDSLLTFSNPLTTDAGDYRCRIISIMQDTVWSQIATLAVDARLPVSVTITGSHTEICDGETVTFDAAAVNGGPQAIYQWTINGSIVGMDSSRLSLDTLETTDIVNCYLISSAGCVSGNPAMSNSLSVNVNSSITPSISITASTNTICQGAEVSFTAVAMNGGSSPDFQWQVNGMNTGTNSAQFLTTSLNDGDQVRCILNSSESCVTNAVAASNSLSIAVSSSLTAAVTITVDANNICQGAEASFSATAMNGGSSPDFQWQINGSDVGTNNAQFSTTGLNNGEEVRCILTSSENCVTNSTVTSNTETMIVQQLLQPAVVISPTAPSICENDNLIFTASGTHEGTTPSYQWQINGMNVGTNSMQFSSTDLIDGDQVKCLMTSSETCVTSRTVSSNTETAIVNKQLSPKLSISASSTDICEGTIVSFTSTTTDGGLSPAYQWMINGQSIGNDNPSLETDQLQNGDRISCQLTSSEECVDQAIVASNEITIVVSPNLAVGLTISADKDSTCAGDTVLFSAEAVNEGSNPQYIWQINGTTVGSSSLDFSTDQLNDGDNIDCTIVSSETCTLMDTIQSNTLSMTILPFVEPSIFLVAQDTAAESCLGDTLSFIANVTNEGASPIYQWLVNGSEVVNDGPEFSTDILNDGDEVSCVLISSAPCLMSPSISSNTLTVKMKDCTSGTSQLVLKQGFEIFPNPASDYITLHFKESLSTVGVRLVDLSGKIVAVFSFPMTYSGMNVSLEIAELPPGVYGLRVDSEEGFSIQKVVVMD